MDHVDFLDRIFSGFRRMTWGLCCCGLDATSDGRICANAGQWPLSLSSCQSDCQCRFAERLNPACWPLDAPTPATHPLKSITSSFRANLPRLPASSLSLWLRLPHHGQILWSCGGCRRDCHSAWVGRLARLPGERAQASSSAPARSPPATTIAQPASLRDPYSHPPFRRW